MQYTHRNGRDEVRSDTKYPDAKTKELLNIRQFNNNGRSSHDTVTLSVKNSLNVERYYFFEQNHHDLNEYLGVMSDVYIEYYHQDK